MASKKSIKDELIKQLTIKRANVSLFLSMVDDYISLWDTKNRIVKDINENGTVLMGIDPAGRVVRKNNPSVKELVMVNKQMLSLLKELGLSTSNVGGEEDDDL